MAWNDRDRIRLEPKKKPNYWFSKYNRVLLHYSVSIDAAAATAADLTPPVQAVAVYIPLSAAAAHSPRSAAFRLFSYLVFNTTVRTQTWQKTPLEYYTTPRTIKITHQGESPTFDLMTSLPVTSLSVTSHPVAMLLSVMSNGTFCTTTIVKKKAGVHFRACAEHTSGNDVTSAQVTSCDVIAVRAAFDDVNSSNACVMARSPLLPPNYALSYPDILLWYLDLGGTLYE